MWILFKKMLRAIEFVFVGLVKMGRLFEFFVTLGLVVFVSIILGGCWVESFL